MHDLVDLRDAKAGFGNKAAGLARLIAAGLPVPPGFAIAEHLFARVVGALELKDLDDAGHVLEAAARRIEEAEVPAELAAEIEAHLKELGGEVIVRSSSAIEDGPRRGGAGVFESIGPVPAELARVWHAIRGVWTSALAPAAIAYARGRTRALALGVIVQQAVSGERITVYTRAPDGSDELVIQRGGTLVRTPRGELPAEFAEQHAAVQALRAERVLGVPADVELVQHAHDVDGERVVETWVVQARPIVMAPPRPVMVEPPPIVIAPLQDGRVWTWDVTHNPDPLSPAQRGLVEMVERERLGDYELRVVAGYLYTSLRRADHDEDAEQLRVHVEDPDRDRDRSSTARSYRDELSAALVLRCRQLEAEAERILADPSTSTDPPRGRSERSDSTNVAMALATYTRFYRLWANELSPRIAELRLRARDEHARVAAAWPHPFRGGGSFAPAPKHRPSSVEAAIAACARGSFDLAELVRRIGAVSPTWDVAVPTFGERTELLQQAIAFARGEPAEEPRREPDSEDRASDRATFGGSIPRGEPAAPGPQPTGERTSAEPSQDRAFARTTLGASMPRGEPAAPRPRPTDERPAEGTDDARGSDAPGSARVAPAAPPRGELELSSENGDLAAIAADLAERDDLLFARAQRRVRAALLARGAELGIGDDIFWIDLELARSAEPLDPIAMQRSAAAARAANARAAAWRMPLVVGRTDESEAASVAPGPPRRETLHGVGAGPRVTGRVVRFASLASAVLAGPGDVIVVRAVTPALAVFVGRCAALVSETGGLLDHGAALARELGITCVVGCRDAWTSLHDDDTVDVDGDAGTVTRR